MPQKTGYYPDILFYPSSYWMSCFTEEVLLLINTASCSNIGQNMHTYFNKQWQVSLINCFYIHVPTTTLLSRIHENAFTGTTVNEFQKTGIFPLHPNVFPEWKHKPEDTTRRPKQDKLECQRSPVTRVSCRRSKPAKSKNSRTVTQTRRQPMKDQDTRRHCGWKEKP